MKKFIKIAAIALATVVAAGSITVPASATEKDAVTSVKITNVKNGVLDLFKGDTYTLKTKVKTTSSKVSKALTFKSTRNAVATVSAKGKIKANRYGETEITATSKVNKNAKASIKVVVSKKVDLNTDGYTEVWRDDFDAPQINRKDWNIEKRAAGWVNNELQEYVDSSENIYIEDGKLVIKPVKNGDHITSGRLTTEGKHDFTYGLFEVRAKVPTGKGYLPAFWLMSTNEGKYGQWPKCGEIDIMEVMGQEPDKLYGTIHYGNPHAESQGTKILQNSDFASEYHDFAVEWEPGRITWFVDGVRYSEQRDWFCGDADETPEKYPAPFNHAFYIILNLAVGGSWVGYPDETTTYADQEFDIDYVKVSRKSQSYYDRLEATAKAPAKKEVKGPKNGIYVQDGQFTAKNNIGDKKNWQFLSTQGGEGSAAVVKDSKFGKNANAVKISSTKAGSEDYSVQFVQANIPLKKGTKYRLTFDAYAAGNRTIITDISAPDRSYARYLNDTKLSLTSKKQTFTYDFNMTSDDDANARLEFNLGNQGSTADVFISNVKIEKTGTFISNYVENPDDLIKNGQFDGNLKRWQAYAYNASNVNAVVDPTVDDKKCTFTITDTGTEDWHIQLKQENVPLYQGQDYKLSFDISSTIDRDIIYAIQRDGNKHNDDWEPYVQTTISINDKTTHVEKVFKMPFVDDEESVFNITMGSVGGKRITTEHTITIDNIVLVPVN